MNLHEQQREDGGGVDANQGVIGDELREPDELIDEAGVFLGIVAELGMEHELVEGDELAIDLHPVFLGGGVQRLDDEAGEAIEELFKAVDAASLVSAQSSLSEARVAEVAQAAVELPVGF